MGRSAIIVTSLDTFYYSVVGIRAREINDWKSRVYFQRSFYFEKLTNHSNKYLTVTKVNYTQFPLASVNIGSI